MTNREKFEKISAVFATLDDADRDEIMEFCEKEIAAITRRNEKAKERATSKRAEGDALRERIYETLGEEPKAIADIVAELADDTITPSKVVARANALVKEGRVTKTTIKVDGRKLVAYSITVEVEEDD